MAIRQRSNRWRQRMARRGSKSESGENGNHGGMKKRKSEKTEIMKIVMKISSIINNWRKRKNKGGENVAIERQQRNGIISGAGGISVAANQ
jgi:hypothetical protein